MNSKLAWVAVATFVAALAACGSGTSTSATGRIDSCVDRMLERATGADASGEAARRYTRDTYCARFEQDGWIYEDGALSIAAHAWLEEGASCATGAEGEPTRTVPCEEERRGGARVLDCALLHHVRDGEVGDYLERLRLEGAVECDDGTPLDELGVPEDAGG